MLQIVCPNTSIDVRIEIERFLIGQVLKSSHVKNFASGKGVNCAFSCDYLQIPARLYAIVGSLDADFFNGLSFEGTASEFFPTNGETRRNLTIIDETGLVAHIRNDGYECSDIFCYKFIETVLARISAGDVLLFSGSVPRGFTEARCQELLEGAKQKGAQIILDSDLMLLESVRASTIDYVKPNIEELAYFMHRNSIVSASDAMEYLKNLGVKSSIVSCGSVGAYLFDSRDDSTLYVTSRFDGDGVDSIGSGDAFLGAFSGSLSRGDSLIQALRMGASAGHSNIFHSGPGRIGETFFSIYEKAEVRNMARSQAFAVIDELLFEKRAVRPSS